MVKGDYCAIFPYSRLIEDRIGSNWTYNIHPTPSSLIDGRLYGAFFLIPEETMLSAVRVQPRYCQAELILEYPTMVLRNSVTFKDGCK